MTTTTNETEAVRQNDPVKMLIRLSAVLSVIMAVTAGVLIWRARSAGEPAATNGSEDAVDYTFTVNPPQERPPQMADVVADFELIERSGEMVSKEDLLGKPTVVSFVFTFCEGPCPRVTNQMRLLQQRFPDGAVRLVTITVDPERDTPRRLAEYADNYGADEGWLFLTKDAETIYPLIRDNFGLSVREATGADRKPGWEIFHSTRIVHVDAAGRIRGKYDALDESHVARLVGALEKELASLEGEETERRREGERGKD